MARVGAGEPPRGGGGQGGAAAPGPGPDGYAEGRCLPADVGDVHVGLTRHVLDDGFEVVLVQEAVAVLRPLAAEIAGGAGAAALRIERRDDETARRQVAVA